MNTNLLLSLLVVMGPMSQTQAAELLGCTPIELDSHIVSLLFTNSITMGNYGILEPSLEVKSVDPVLRKRRILTDYAVGCR